MKFLFAAITLLNFSLATIVQGFPQTVEVVRQDETSRGTNGIGFRVGHLAVWKVEDGVQRFDASLLLTLIKSKVQPEVWKAGRAEIWADTKTQSLYLHSESRSDIPNEIAALLRRLDAFGAHDLQTQLENNQKEAKKSQRKIALYIGEPDSSATDQFYQLKQNSGRIRSLLKNYYVVQCIPPERISQFRGLPMKSLNGKNAYVVILDAEANVLASESFDALSGSEESALEELLDAQRMEYSDAIELVEKAIGVAKESERNVLLQMGGPACGGCVLMTELFQKHSDVLDRDYVWLKLDVRMKNIQAIKERFGLDFKTIPSLAIISPEGKVLADSKSEGKNIGFPSTESDLQHFRHIFRTTSKRMQPEELYELSDNTKTIRSKRVLEHRWH